MLEQGMQKRPIFRSFFCEIFIIVCIQYRICITIYSRRCYIMYKNPKSFFVRLLLLTLLTVINVVLLVILSAGGTTGLIIALILTVINAFFILFMLVVSIINFFRYLADKERDHLGFHLINVLFSLGLTIIFGVFYFAIVAGAIIVLLPFL